MSERKAQYSLFRQSTAIKSASYRKAAVFDWIRSFASKRYAVAAMFICNFFESSVSPLPSDLIYLPLCISNPRKSMNFAFWSVVSSVLGGAVGYYIGYYFMEAFGYGIVEFYNSQRLWDDIVRSYNGRFGIWFVAIAAFTPLPYKFATLSAGATQMDFLSFIVMSVLGRMARSYTIAALFYYFGGRFERILKKYYLAFSIGFTAMFFAGYFVTKFLF